jgi:uncharacterized protein YndB with AHSA1/START domain
MNGDWEHEHILESSAAPEAIYRLYENVDLRPQWDRSVESMTLDGPFAAGTAGVMVIEGQGPMPFTIVAAERDHGFTDRTELPGAALTLEFTHDLTPLPNGKTAIRHRLVISGPDADAMGSEVGPMIVADFPEAMTALARLAEEAK